VLTLAALALIALNCVFNPKIRFLTPGPGKWIVFPLPPRLHTYDGFELTGTFRRAFVLPEKPAAALLSWRCMTNGELRINGTVVPRSGSSSGNWKTTSHLDIRPFLRQGSNEISVMVANGLGPPALSLKLKSGNFLLTSDETWEVSVSGSNWRPARAASATPRPGKGNELSLLETTSGALGRCWSRLCLFAAISICGTALLQFYIGRVTSTSLSARWRRRNLQYYIGRVTSFSASAWPKIILLMLTVAWALLFLHNLPLMPAASGFDAPEHLAYVSSIQDYKMQPSAAEGYETFQPPLYYLISAILLDLGDCGVFQPLGMKLLQFLSLAIGAVTLALVLTGLRLIFPGDWKKPLAGLVLAAFLPAHICLLHYITNETLSAMFVTAALCVGLRLLQSERAWWGWYGVLGIVLGLALLSKASAALAVLAILGVLAARLLMLRRKWELEAWLGNIGAPLLICLLIGGWHYLKLWRDYGNPFIGNWDPRMVAPWWQARGFQTPGYYFSFGDSLTRPFFSGLHSFWDAFYTTLWGDGLWGGRTDLPSRPPWNYDLMTAGFVLALVPTALVLTGLARAIARSFRDANLIRLLLNSLGWLFAFAILAMSFKVPSYAQTKAFYGLPALLPFCAMGALGFEFWAGCGKVARYVLGVALGIWLLNVYASFWIKPKTVQFELSSDIAASLYARWDSSEASWKVLHYYPGNSQAAIWLASVESQKDPEQAVKRLEQALKDDPANAQIETALANNLALCERLDEAVVHAKHAVELAPEDEAASQTWCRLALRRKDYLEAVTAGRDALSLNPTYVGIHFNLGLALMNLRQIPEATSHFSAIVDAQPTWAESQFSLGLCLLDQPGKRDEGLDHLKEAVRLNPTNTAWQAALQNASKGH